jgi:S1-C subfamily serine protease
VPGDQLTFFGDVQLTITVGDDNSIDGSWADDSSIREGTPVVNQRGELVALCSHADGVARLVQLANLDELQQAIAAYTGTAKVWLGIALNDAPSGELSISAVEPAGPAASAGVTSGDVIVTIDGAAIANRQALTTALAIHVPGDVVQLGILRSDGTSLTLAITLADPKTTL